MKSVVKEKAEQEIALPCLMKNPHTGLIILATGKNDNGYSGFVEHSGEEKSYLPGDERNTWNPNGFVVFDGSVTLSND